MRGEIAHFHSHKRRQRAKSNIYIRLPCAPFPAVMNSRVLSLLALLSLATSAFGQAQPTPPPDVATGELTTSFDFKDGDNVVLLGGTLIEREQRYGTFETALTLATADKKVTVRNLAWSGDTVHGDARSYFGPPAEGLQRLATQLELVKPTVVLLNYGTDFAHASLKGLPAFLSAYRDLIISIRQKAPGVRLILTTPPPMENLGAPLPDQDGANKKLASLREALVQLSRSQNAFLLDWFELMGGVPKPGRVQAPLTENGIHYTEKGYQKLAAVTLKALALTSPDAPTAQVEELRKEILKKNFLFFNRYRPHNETYLFGFRKHEQGQNGKEIPMFDPIIAEADQKIHALKLKAIGAAQRP